MTVIESESPLKRFQDWAIKALFGALVFFIAMWENYQRIDVDARFDAQRLRVESKLEDALTREQIVRVISDQAAIETRIKQIDGLASQIAELRVEMGVLQRRLDADNPANVDP